MHSKKMESGNQETKRFELGKQERRMFSSPVFLFSCFPVFLFSCFPVFLFSYFPDSSSNSCFPRLPD